ncbi:MAG: PGPGW domain-containing protein [Pseudomonadota bacterium]
MINALLTFIGFTLIGLGALIVFLPIPLGLLMIVTGIAILVSTSLKAQRFFRWLREKAKPVDAAFDKAEEILPEPIAAPLKETDPDEEPAPLRKTKAPLPAHQPSYISKIGPTRLRPLHHRFSNR